jgi:hypothetical protein
MSRLQRTRRLYTWAGAAITLLLSVLWMLASAYAERITN